MKNLKPINQRSLTSDAAPHYFFTTSEESNSDNVNKSNSFKSPANNARSGSNQFFGTQSLPSNEFYYSPKIMLSGTKKTIYASKQSPDQKSASYRQSSRDKNSASYRQSPVDKSTSSI